MDAASEEVWSEGQAFRRRDWFGFAKAFKEHGYVRVVRGGAPKDSLVRK